VKGVCTPHAPAICTSHAGDSVLRTQRSQLSLWPDDENQARNLSNSTSNFYRAAQSGENPPIRAEIRGPAGGEQSVADPASSTARPGGGQ
jgi:hypothetical protein